MNIPLFWENQKRDQMVDKQLIHRLILFILSDYIIILYYFLLIFQQMFCQQSKVNPGQIRSNITNQNQTIHDIW